MQLEAAYSPLSREIQAWLMWDHKAHLQLSHAFYKSGLDVAGFLLSLEDVRRGHAIIDKLGLLLIAQTYNKFIAYPQIKELHEVLNIKPDQHFNYGPHHLVIFNLNNN